MILRMWTTNFDGVILEDAKAIVRSRQEASTVLAGALFESATDEFFHDALTQWFVSGKIDVLSENVNNTEFWNVALLDTDSQ